MIDKSRFYGVGEPLVQRERDQGIPSERYVYLSFNFSNVFEIWAMITLVVLLVRIFVPYKDWSAKLMEALGVKTGGIGYKLADNVLPCLILNTCNTFLSRRLIFCTMRRYRRKGDIILVQKEQFSIVSGIAVTGDSAGSRGLGGHIGLG